MEMPNKTEEEKHERVLEYETQQLYQGLLPYGFCDVRTAVEFFMEAGLTGENLADQVTEFCDDTETKIADVDLCYIAYDHVLQMARNKIDAVLGFDFQNDGPGIDVYGNYCCTTYDYIDAAIEQLTEKLNGATEEQKAELKEDKLTMFFLQQIDVEV